MNWIGQDFSSKMKLNLLPGVHIQPGYWQVQIDYISESSNTTIYHNSTFMAAGHRQQDYDVVIGIDVRNIHLTMHRHSPFPGSSSNIINKNLSVHALILLNFAHRLLKIK
jgi:hypothetical protein